MANEVSAPLPDLDWPDQAIIHVAAGDASAKITKFVIHLAQDVPEDVLAQAHVVPLFSYGASG